MSVIFPGNYVADLNAYREQGVYATPGVEFYQVRGVALVSANLTGGGTLSPQILSPDLRQDDKPRKDKPFIVPAGAVIYKVAVAAPGVKAAAAGNTVKVAPTATGGFPATPTLTAGADLYFPAEGAGSALPSILDGTAVGSDTQVQVVTVGDFVASQNPSAGACRNSPSAILVEVCYYRSSPAPDAEDAHIPYAVEAGQGT